MEGNSITIIAEVPHQRPATAWIANNNKHIIDIANSEHGFIYEPWTLAKAVECWGEDEIPENLAQALKEYGNVVEVGDSSNTEFYNAKAAESELEAAKEAIGHDLSACYFLSINDAKEFADAYSGHQGSAARSAVIQALDDI